MWKVRQQLVLYFPISPSRGNERAAAIWKHYQQQQQSAAALDGAHQLQ